MKSFVFLILELFPEQVNKYNNKKLLDLEDLYFKSLVPNYNILTEAVIVLVISIFKWTELK